MVEADPGRLPVGTMLGAYRIEALLGQGAFGAVFRAIATPSGRAVAVKVLAERADPTDAAVARFHREAELASRLRHPNSVRVLDRGDSAGWQFIVFELLEGESVEAALQRSGRMAPLRAIHIGTEVLSALEEAHGIGLIHRDIKPANVFLTAGPAGSGVKLVDFGIAKSTKAGTIAGLTRAGTTLGTPLYMSPEQISGETLGPASDLYAVALLVAEMVHGGSIYPEAPVMVLLTERIAGKPLPLPPELLGSPLRAVIERATRLDPRERYAAASEMKQALQRVTQSSGELAKIAEAATRSISIEELAGAPTVAAPRVVRRSRVWIGVLAALVLAGAGVAALIVAMPFLSPPTRGSSSARAASAAQSAKLVRREASALVPIASVVRPIAPHSASVDFLTDVAPLLRVLRERFGSSRVQGVRVNRDDAYVTVEDPKDPTRTILYTVTGAGAAEHDRSAGEHVAAPLDLSSSLFDEIPAFVKDAPSHVSTTDKVEFVGIQCPSCVAHGGGIHVYFTDRGGTPTHEVEYGPTGKLVSVL
jgi:hypothetical protein